jgi:signal transduction histidine kinase
MDLEVIDTLQERIIPEERITNGKGRVRWLQTVKRPIIESDGSAKQVLGASTDITQRKKTEIELREQRAELAHVARISTMGELAASLAHELNQPLTAILSNAQAALRFLSGKPADIEEVREILQDIVKDNSRAGDVICRMRALVKKNRSSLLRSISQVLSAMLWCWCTAMPFCETLKSRLHWMTTCQPCSATKSNCSRLCSMFY